MSSKSKYAKRSKIAERRELSDQKLLDVVTVIKNPHEYNRATRKLVFSLWRTHCNFLRVDFRKALEAVQDKVKLTAGAVPAIVQYRLLSGASLI